jgi:Tol biopolymer transport system component
MNSGLSPDGKILAITKSGENRIRLLSLSGEPARELVLKNWNTFSSVDWAADSRGLFVTSNPTGWRSSLLYVDLNGKTRSVASQECVAYLGNRIPKRKVRRHPSTHHE